MDKSILLQGGVTELDGEIKNHTRVMKVIDSQLQESILKNFDLFNRAFENFEEVRHDMSDARQKTKAIL